MNKKPELQIPPPGSPPLIDVSFIERKYLDIPYAAVSPSQTLDLYLPPQGDGPFPVIVHIHGGAFRICDKRDGQLRPWLDGVNRGYAVASINYRMSGEAIFPAAVFDCKAALRFLRGNAEKYHLDGTHLAVVGGSAGGNLAEMVAVSANMTALSDLSLGYAEESCAVQACAAWFGPTDFLLMDQQLAEKGLGPCDHNDPDSPESEYMGGQITQLDSDWVHQADPATYISDDLPPMFIQHGSRDHLVPVGQSEIFVAAIQEKLGEDRVTFEVLEGADHADTMFATKENMEKNFAFLDTYLKL